MSAEEGEMDLEKDVIFTGMIRGPGGLEFCIFAGEVNDPDEVPVLIDHLRSNSEQKFIYFLGAFRIKSPFDFSTFEQVFDEKELILGLSGRILYLLQKMGVVNQLVLIGIKMLPIHKNTETSTSLSKTFVENTRKLLIENGLASSATSMNQELQKDNDEFSFIEKKRVFFTDAASFLAPRDLSRPEKSRVNWNQAKKVNLRLETRSAFDQKQREKKFDVFYQEDTRNFRPGNVFWGTEFRCSQRNKANPVEPVQTKKGFLTKRAAEKEFNIRLIANGVTEEDEKNMEFLAKHDTSPLTQKLTLALQTLAQRESLEVFQFFEEVRLGAFLRNFDLRATPDLVFQKIKMIFLQNQTLRPQKMKEIHSNFETLCVFLKEAVRWWELTSQLISAKNGKSNRESLLSVSEAIGCEEDARRNEKAATERSRIIMNPKGKMVKEVREVRNFDFNGIPSKEESVKTTRLDQEKEPTEAQKKYFSEETKKQREMSVLTHELFEETTQGRKTKRKLEESFLKEETVQRKKEKAGLKRKEEEEETSASRRGREMGQGKKEDLGHSREIHQSGKGESVSGYGNKNKGESFSPDEREKSASKSKEKKNVEKQYRPKALVSFLKSFKRKLSLSRESSRSPNKSANKEDSKNGNSRPFEIILSTSLPDHPASRTRVTGGFLKQVNSRKHSSTPGLLKTSTRTKWGTFEEKEKSTLTQDQRDLTQSGDPNGETVKSALDGEKGKEALIGDKGNGVFNGEKGKEALNEKKGKAVLDQEKGTVDKTEKREKQDQVFLESMRKLPKIQRKALRKKETQKRNPKRGENEKLLRDLMGHDSDLFGGQLVPMKISQEKKREKNRGNSNEKEVEIAKDLKGAQEPKSKGPARWIAKGNSENQDKKPREFRSRTTSVGNAKQSQREKESHQIKETIRGIRQKETQEDIKTKKYKRNKGKEKAREARLVNAEIKKERLPSASSSKPVHTDSRASSKTGRRGVPLAQINKPNVLPQRTPETLQKTPEVVQRAPDPLQREAIPLLQKGAEPLQKTHDASSQEVPSQIPQKSLNMNKQTPHDLPFQQKNERTPSPQRREAQVLPSEIINHNQRPIPLDIQNAKKESAIQTPKETQHSIPNEVDRKEKPTRKQKEIEKDLERQKETFKIIVSPPKALNESTPMQSEKTEGGSSLAQKEEPKPLESQKYFAKELPLEKPQEKNEKQRASDHSSPALKYSFFEEKAQSKENVLEKIEEEKPKEIQKRDQSVRTQNRKEENANERVQLEENKREKTPEGGNQRSKSPKKAPTAKAEKKKKHTGKEEAKKQLEATLDHFIGSGIPEMVFSENEMMSSEDEKALENLEEIAAELKQYRNALFKDDSD